MNTDFDFSATPDARPMSSRETPSYLENLNPPQREAATTTEGPLIVLAGAGSGKTKMLTSRIAYLIGQMRVAPHQILAVTFTNKAAQEMQERVTRALAEESGGYSLGRPEIGTFHSVCVRILRREMEKLPFTKPFVIYDDSDQLSLIKTTLNKLDIDQKNFNPKALRGSINLAKCDALEPHEISVENQSPYTKVFKAVYEEYQKQLVANNALDFGEIICMTYRLFRDHLDVRERNQKRYRYIHVDEYQDTNRAQYLLLSTLASPQFGGHENICVVGDEDQSIYKWRGADIKNILDFEREYPSAQLVKLEQNYRSTKNIISAASELIRNNLSRKDKELWTDNEEGELITRLQVPDERVEAEFVVSEIMRLARDEGYSFDEFAIFYRTHAQSRQFEDFLRREKIAYQIIGGTRFYDRREIKDILSYMRVILNPSDSVSLKRIINVPARGIGKTTLDKLEQVPAENLWQLLQDISDGKSDVAGRAASKIARFVQIMRKLMLEQPQIGLAELYHIILDQTGYVIELRQEDTVEARARIENLEELDNMIQEFEEERLSEVAEADLATAKSTLLPLFLERTLLESTEVESAEAKIDPTSVKLMTLHGAKGLEFPVVFMVGMEEGLFPSFRPWEETPPEEIEEERRLCYVGITRARKHLYMLNAVVRRLWGTVNYQDPARFFAEIPAGLVRFRDLTARASVAPRAVSSSAPVSRITLDPQVGDDLVGRHVDHPDYGYGTILSVEGTSNDRKVVVEFKNRSRRKFLYRYVASYLD